MRLRIACAAERLIARFSEGVGGGGVGVGLVSSMRSVCRDRRRVLVVIGGVSRGVRCLIAM